MNHNKKANKFEKLISLYLVAISVIYTFYYKIAIDKYVGFFVVIVAFLLTIFRKKSLQFLRNETLDIYIFFIGITSLTAVYLFQTIRFGVVFNVEVFNIFSIYATLIFYKLTKNIFNYLFFIKLFGVLFFFFLIINIIKLDGLSVGVSQQGFYSFISYLCFIIFYFFYTSNKLVIIFSGLFILITQTRILILSMLVIIMKSSIFGAKNIMRGLIAIFIILLLLYIFFPDSRIFLLHTSGRLVHWEKILYSFDFSNIWTGMGSTSSKTLLGDLGVIETMGRAHNEFLTYFYELGLLGVIALLCILKLIHSSSSNNGRIVFYTIVIQMVTDNIFTYYFNYLLPLILCLLIENDQSVEREKSSSVTEKVTTK